MDTSLRLPAADVPALQPARPPLRPDDGVAAQPDQAAPESGPSVQVSISEQGRAAEQAARLEATAVSGVPAEAGVANPVSAPADAAATAPAVSAVATPGPASDPARVRQAQVASAESRGVANVEASTAERPDAATAASSPSVQLYLDNASRPSAQPGPSAVRISA